MAEKRQANVHLPLDLSGVPILALAPGDEAAPEQTLGVGGANTRHFDMKPIGIGSMVRCTAPPDQGIYVITDYAAATQCKTSFGFVPAGGAVDFRCLEYIHVMAQTSAVAWAPQRLV